RDARAPTPPFFRTLLMAALDGRPDEAAAGLRAALAAPDLFVLPYQRARVRLVLARSLVALGRRDEVLAVARAAQGDLARWPGWRRDEVNALVDRLVGSRPAPGGGDAELTARERGVAVLLADG